MLNQHGIAGIRSSLIDKTGFVPEALLVGEGRSVHVLNYNSPGATGAPAFSAAFVSALGAKGYLDGVPKGDEKSPQEDLWDLSRIADLELNLQSN